MSQTEAPLVLRLSSSVKAGVIEYAEAEGMEMAEAVEALLAKALLATSKNPDVLARIKAQIAVTEFVEAVTEARRDGGDWGRDVTHEIFRQVREERLPEYAVAVGGNAYASGVEEKAQLNRRLGRRIRRILDAEVEKNDAGKPAQASPPAAGGPWLIRSYTPFVPPAGTRKAA